MFVRKLLEWLRGPQIEASPVIVGDKWGSLTRDQYDRLLASVPADLVLLCGVRVADLSEDLRTHFNKCGTCVQLGRFPPS